VRIPDDFLQEIRARNRIEDVVSSYVVLKRRGKNIVGLCPFHGEKTPSFTLYPDNGSYYCFGCAAGGDVITFVRQAEKLDYVEAVRFLADRSGLHMPEEGYDDGLSKLKARIREANRAAMSYYHYMLSQPAGAVGLNYFRSRKLTDDTIRAFSLGFAPDGWDNLLKHMKAKGFSEDILLKAGLAGRSQKGTVYDFFRNRVMFPIVDVRGNVAAFGGRVMDDSKPKYINTSDTPVFKKTNTMYALNLAKNRKDRRLMLAEGYMDVIAMHQAGFTEAVACLGTAFTDDHANLINRYADEVTLVSDTDEAGQKAQKKIMSILGKTAVKIKVLNLPQGKDADEYIRVKGSDEFGYLLKKAGNHIEYQLYKAKDSRNIDIPQEKVEYLKEAAEIIAAINEPVERDVYISKVCEEASVSVTAMTEQVKKLLYARRKRAEKAVLREAVQNTAGYVEPSGSRQPDNLLASSAEGKIIAILLLRSEFYSEVRQRIQGEDFITSFYRKVYEAMEQRLIDGQEVSITSLSAEFSVEEMGKISSVLAKESQWSHTVQELSECVETLKREKEKKKIKEDMNSGDVDLNEFFKGLSGSKNKWEE